MAFDRGRPGSVLGRPTRVGLPYHGLVMGSSLTLPNGQQITYTQPPRGGTYEIRRPGWVAPAPTAPQIAYDTANGFEWRDYALMTGAVRSDSGQMHLGGQPINGWIWFDPQGQPWRVAVLGYGGSNNAARVPSFRFSRFGVMGAESETFDRAAPAFSIAQSIAQTIQHRPVAGGSLQTLAADSAAIRHKLVDVTPDGSRTLWCAFCMHYTTNPQTPFVERPVAFYEITVSTAGEVSGAVIKGRAECVGDLQTLSIPPYACQVSTLEQINPEIIYSGCTESFDWETTTTVTAGAVSYDWYLTQPTGSVTAIDALGRGYVDVMGIGHLAPQTVTRSYSAIVAGWYNSGGAAQFAAIEISMERVTDGSHALNVTRSSYVQTCTGGVFNESAPIGFSFNATSTEHTTARVALMVGGAVVSAETRETIRTLSMSGSGGYPHPAGTNLALDATGTAQAEIKKNGATVSTSSQPWSVSSTAFLGGVIWAHIFGPQFIGVAPSIPINESSTLQSALSFIPARLSGEGEVDYVSAALWDETTVGLTVQRLAADGVAEHRFLTAYARGAPVAGAAQTVTPAHGFDVLVYPVGSYQPVTGEWSGAVGETQPAARSWV